MKRLFQTAAHAAAQAVLYVLENEDHSQPKRPRTDPEESQNSQDARPAVPFGHAKSNPALAAATTGLEPHGARVDWPALKQRVQEFLDSDSALDFVLNQDHCNIMVSQFLEQEKAWWFDDNTCPKARANLIYRFNETFREKIAQLRCLAREQQKGFAEDLTTRLRYVNRCLAERQEPDSDEDDCVLVSKPEPEQAEPKKAEQLAVVPTGRWVRNPDRMCPPACCECKIEAKFFSPKTPLAEKDQPCMFHIRNLAYICQLCMRSCEENNGERCDKCQTLHEEHDLFEPFKKYSVDAPNGRVALRLLKRQDSNLKWRLEFDETKMNSSWNKSDWHEDNMLAYLNKHAKKNTLSVYGNHKTCGLLGTETFVFDVKEDVTIKFYLNLVTGQPPVPVVTVDICRKD